MTRDKVNILGVGVTCLSKMQVLDRIRDVLKAEEKHTHYVSATSVHGVIEAQKDPAFRQILNNALIVHPDGMPLVVHGKRVGAPNSMERIKGPDLFFDVCRMSAMMPVKHYFYGGREGIAERLGREMQTLCPGLEVAGHYCPPFRPLTMQEKKSIAEEINASGADIVWVGLSTPKQERWMAEFQPLLKVKLMFSIGAAFDYYTDGLSFAPQWMQDASLEWLFRLYEEPGRLWKRYASIVPQFLLLSSLQRTGLRKFPWNDEG